MAKNSVIIALAALLLFSGYLLLREDAAPPMKPPDMVKHEVEAREELVTTPLAKLVDEMFSAPEFSSAALGFCLLDEQGKLLLGRGEAVSFIPASTLKTLTSATALEILGPEFRFETSLLAQAKISESGELAGDLVIAGGGDPTLNTADLAHWVSELRKAGLVKITGGVVADATFFPEAIAGDYWNWSDVGNGYGSPAAGLNLNHNRFVATFRSGASEGEPAKLLGVEPPVPGVELNNRVITGSAGSGDAVSIYGGPNATRLFLRGSIPPGTSEFGVEGAVPDPALFAAHEFHRQLREAGVEIGKPPRALPFGDVVSGRVPLLVHPSAPLAEIVQHLHEVSDNHEAECLYRLLGKRGGMPPDAVIRNHWRERGLDLSDCRMVDGSGLSRANFISAKDLTQLQHLARRGPCGEVYYQSLNAYFEGSVRWKGGAMSSIRSYTGFVTTSSGREMTFSLMFNHYLDGAAVSSWRDRIARALLEVE